MSDSKKNSAASKTKRADEMSKFRYRGVENTLKQQQQFLEDHLTKLESIKTQLKLATHNTPDYEN